MHDLNDVQFFAAVVENQGFSAAARNLSLPKSSVSRRIASLEARLGVRLIERSTRSLRLTEVGVSFYDRCRAILADLDAAEREVAVQRGEPVGLVRMSCPTGLAQFVLAKILPGFLVRYPKVRLQVLATNRTIDLVDDNIDIAIRARERTEDEAVMMRMLYKSGLIFVASPAFASTQQSAVRVDTLSSFPFLSFVEDSQRQTWALSGPNAATQRFHSIRCCDRAISRYCYEPLQPVWELPFCRPKWLTMRSAPSAWSEFCPSGTAKKSCISYSRPIAELFPPSES